MPDRVIRDELLRSERWLDLPTDSHRLVYAALILEADDYGNVEGGPRRLYRWMHNFTQIKTEADSIKLMSDLQDAEMVLRYEVENKEFWHLTRFRNSRQFWSRKHPQSPYEDDVTIEEKQRFTKKSIKHDLNEDNTRILRSRRGVGVGEERVVELDSSSVLETSTTREKSKKRGSADATPFVLPDWIPKDDWDAWVEMRKKSKKPPTAYAMRLAVMKLDNLREQGHAPGQVLMQSAFAGWTDLYAPKAPQTERK